MPAHHRIVIICAAGYALCLALPAAATSGRTNAKGCHNSKSAGYNCHGSKAVPHKPKPSAKTSEPKASAQGLGVR